MIKARLALVALLGTLVGWGIANTYAPMKVTRDSTLVGRRVDVGEYGQTRYIVILAYGREQAWAIEIPPEDYAVLPAGRAPMIVTEHMEWITGRHYGWRIRYRPYNKTQTMPEG